MAKTSTLSTAEDLFSRRLTTVLQGDDSLDNPGDEVCGPGLRGLQRGNLHAGADGELPVYAADALRVRDDTSANPDVPLGSSGPPVGEAARRDFYLTFVA